MNLGDNTGDTRATVLIYVEPIGTLQARDYKGVNHEGARDGKLVIMETDPIVFYGNRVDDIRIQGDVINTLQARMGTGGGNMPIMNEGQTVRRLTPMECERLQGFPDEWTKFDAEGKEVTDGHRYKQMGNAVAVPVVSWIVNRLMVATNDMD